MELKELMKMAPGELAGTQRLKLGQAVAERLRDVAMFIERGEDSDYTRVEDDLLGHSPAGDDMGPDKSFIDFGDLLESNDGHGTDLQQVVDTLRALKIQQYVGK